MSGSGLGEDCMHISERRAVYRTEGVPEVHAPLVVRVQDRADDNASGKVGVVLDAKPQGRFGEEHFVESLLKRSSVDFFRHFTPAYLGAFFDEAKELRHVHLTAAGSVVGVNESMQQRRRHWTAQQIGECWR